MKVLTKGFFIAVFAVLTLVSCKDGQSLQEYYVDNKDNNDFMMVDVPTSLISKDSKMLNDDQQKILNTVKKVNIMVYPLNDKTKTNFATEKVKVSEILASDDYDELMKVNMDEGGMKIYMKGEEDAIDEIIVMASEDSKGFMLARLLGDDMNIADMMKMVQSMEEGNIDVSQFEGVMDIFKEIQ